MNEMSLRRLAIELPTPVYPDRSLVREISGVTVASILIGTDGAVEETVLLEAPDFETGESVVTALKAARFPEIDHDGVPVKVRTTMTYYFEAESGEVLSPGEIDASIGDQAGGRRRASAEDPASEGVIIDEVQFEVLLGQETIQLIDVRTRQAFQDFHRDGAINIPLSELLVRATRELSESRPTIIDCNIEFETKCHTARRVLSGTGFDRLFILME